MKAKLYNFVNSLLSRKFLLTVIGASALWSIHQYGEMVVLLLGYLGVEGGADLVTRYKGRTLTASDVQNAMSQNIDDAPDTSRVVTGKPESAPLFNEEPEE